MAEGLLNYTRLDDPPELVDHTQGRPLCADDELRIVDGAGEPVRRVKKANYWCVARTRSTATFAPSATTIAASIPTGSTAAATLSASSDDGYLVVTGRVKDVICRGGETISAQDLEEQMLSHPAIFSAAAVPLPDPYLGRKNLRCSRFHWAADQPCGTERLPRRAWCRRTRPARHAGRDDVAAHDADRQDRQKGDRPRAEHGGWSLGAPTVTPLPEIGRSRIQSWRSARASHPILPLTNVTICD